MRPVDEFLGKGLIGTVIAIVVAFWWLTSR
jgi:hypothetical protein